MSVVLDAWAVVALLKDEQAAARVRSAIDAHDARVCSINLGEAYYSLVRSHGAQIAGDRVDVVRQVMDVEDPDWPLVRDAATIKARGGLSYPDAFCVATARRHGVPLYTGDPEIVALDGDDLDVVDLREPS